MWRDSSRATAVNPATHVDGKLEVRPVLGLGKRDHLYTRRVEVGALAGGEGVEVADDHVNGDSGGARFRPRPVRCEADVGAPT